MKVLIAKAPPPAEWTKFHRDAGCSGLRKGELADGATYVERELEELPDTVKPCQFPCCFQGYQTAGELKSRVHDRPAPRPERGIRVGQVVEFRELGGREVTGVRIVRGAASRAKGELSADTAIARGLLGHEAGEVVEISLPRKVMRIEILKVG